jgi:RNA polymerase sigma factor (sigma-70 family)
LDREGPHREFKTFFEDERERLGRALYLVTGDIGEADDLAQDAFVRVFEGWDRIGTMDSPTGYLYRTALNLHRSRRRKRTSSARHESVPIDRDELAVVEDRETIVRSLAQLTPNQREALVLTEWLGLDSEQAADVMRINASTVRVHLSRARAILRGARVIIDE